MDTQELIGQAAKGLKLRDIMLYQASFGRPKPDFGDGPGEGFQQGKRAVSFTEGEAAGGEGAAKRLLQIRVELGTRVVSDPTGPEPEVLFFIEAEYIVEYELIDHLPEEAIKAFAEFNAIHNVWPFWRQHVFDIVQRAKLPHLDVPLFSGAKL